MSYRHVCTALILLCAPAAAFDYVDFVRNSVCSCGDLDGDGHPDFALALRSDSARSFQDEANPKVRTDNQGRVLLVSAVDGRRLGTIEPPERDPEFGRIVEFLGDVEGDGHPELLVGGRRRLWVVGTTGDQAPRELGQRWSREGFARCAAVLGDVSGDGVADVIATRDELSVFLEPGEDDPRAPEDRHALVLVLDGRSGETLFVFGFAGESPFGEAADAPRYVALAGADLHGAPGGIPDRDGDGRAEIVLPIEEAAAGPSSTKRERLELRSSDGARVLQRIDLPDDAQGAPWVVRDPGDVNGDGVRDLLLSIIDEDVACYSGANGERLYAHDYRGAYLKAEGSSLEVLGDVDGDGVADFVMGANESGMDIDPGFARSFSGATGVQLGTLSFGYDLYDGKVGVGVDVCAIPDASGDGLPDIVAHLPRLREVRILSGRTCKEIRRFDVGPDSALVK